LLESHDITEKYFSSLYECMFSNQEFTVSGINIALGKDTHQSSTKTPTQLYDSKLAVDGKIKTKCIIRSTWRNRKSLTHFIKMLYGVQLAMSGIRTHNFSGDRH
jgi:hypothetical protein